MKAVSATAHASGDEREPTPITLADLDACTLIDTSERRQAYLLTRSNGAYLRLSPSVYHLLRLRVSGMDSDEVAQRMRGTDGREVTTEEVEAAYEGVVASIQKIEAEFSPTFFGLWVRIKVLPEAFVARVATLLAPAYRGPMPLLFLGLIVAASWKSLGYEYPINPLSSHFWIGYVLFISSLVAHEFGHASACARFGARPGEIGAAIYLVFPAFYANVSSAWKLKRWERVIVDAGGVYFQLVVGAAYTFLYEATGWAPFKLAALAIGANSLFMLNPIFKFDGYWLLSDALGVTNLSQQPRRIIAHFKDRLRGRPTQPLPWPGPVKAFLSMYSMVTVGGWMAFMVLLIPWLWTRHLSGYPALASGLLTDVMASPGSVDPERIRAFFSATFFSVLGLLMLWRTLRGAVLVRVAAALRRWYSSRPAAA